MAKKKEKSFIEKIKIGFSKMLIGSIILNVLFLLFGIFVYSNPRISLEALGVLLGIYFIIFGIYAIFEFVGRSEYPLYGLNIVWGILAIIAGFLAVVNPFNFTSVLTLALGIFLIISSISKIIDSFKLKKYKYDGWSLILAISIILLIFGIFIILNPIIAAMEITEVSGIFIILASILEICNCIMLYTKAKDVLELFKK